MKSLLRTWTLLATPFLGVAAILAGPSGVSTDARAESILRISANTPLRSLDPAKFSLGALEFNYSALVYDRLTAFDSKLNPVPDLAESWESSPDLKTWTFHLRHGVKFHGGREVNAEDVAATYQRLADPANHSVILGSVKLISNIEAPDPYTVRFTLSGPYAAWPAITAAFQAAVLPRDQVDTITTNQIGTGPYKFVSYDPNNALELARNPDYFDPAAAPFDRVEFKIIPDYGTAVAALQRGEIDIVWALPPESADKIRNNPDVHVSEIPAGIWAMYGMNESVPPFDNPKVRQAIFKLVDRQTISEISLFGHGTPTLSPLPPFHPFYDTAIPIQKGNPEAAKKLLADAGYPNGLTVQLWLPAQQPVLERMAVALRDEGKLANLTIEINPVPEDQFRPSTRPFTINNFSIRTVPDTMLYDWYHSTGSWNTQNWHFKNAEVDQLLDTARQTADAAEQKKLYTRFQEIAANDGPGPVVFVLYHADGIGMRVKGYQASPTRTINLRGVTLSNLRTAFDARFGLAGDALC
jgi:peptide/nickel transport system substrate-binding protein